MPIADIIATDEDFTDKWYTLRCPDSPKLKSEIRIRINWLTLDFISTWDEDDIHT